VPVTAVKTKLPEVSAARAESVLTERPVTAVAVADAQVEMALHLVRSSMKMA
jgi:hypothetical protein